MIQPDHTTTRLYNNQIIIQPDYNTTKGNLGNLSCNILGKYFFLLLLNHAE